MPCSFSPSANGTYLDLFIGGDSTEDNLCEALCGKHAETDPPYHLGIFHQRQTLVFSAENEKIHPLFSMRVKNCKRQR